MIAVIDGIGLCAALVAGFLIWRGKETIAGDQLFLLFGLAALNAFHSLGNALEWANIYEPIDNVEEFAEMFIPAFWAGLIYSFAQKSIQGELQERERTYRFLAENTGDIVFSQDMSGQLTYISPAVERMFGYTPEEFLSLDPMSTIAPESRDEARQSFLRSAEEAHKGAVDVPLMQFKYLRRNGDTFWGEIHASFIYDDNGRPIGTQGTMRDITDRKKTEQEKSLLEQQLLQAQKMEAIGRLAGGIAHDYNNQLAGIMGYADLIRNSATDDAELQSYADMICSLGGHAANRVRQLLAFARKDALRFEKVDIHAVVAETIACVHHDLPPAIHIKTDFDALHHTVEGDFSQLQSALLNLTLNARDALTGGGEIVIRTKAVLVGEQCVMPPDFTVNAGKYLCISIEDNGEGIDQSVLGHIFEPFFTTKPAGKGTGLGLAAVYGIAKAHQGYVTCSSSPGKTVFSLHIPLSDIGDAKTALIEQPREYENRLSVLVVDDEPQVCDISVRMLREEGHEAHAFTNGRDAVAWYQCHWRTIDLVLLDLSMPDNSGVDILRRMRLTNEKAKALFFSGYAADEREIVGIAKSDILQKPFSRKQLLASIERAAVGA